MEQAFVYKEHIGIVGECGKGAEGAEKCIHCVLQHINIIYKVNSRGKACSHYNAGEAVADECPVWEFILIKKGGYGKTECGSQKRKHAD